MQRLLAVVLLGLASTVLAAPEPGPPFDLPVLPREDSTRIDDETGVELLFLTRGETKDTNLYFHQRSWLADGSLILFVSAREKGGLMGYVVETGELVRITAADGARLGNATAAVNRNSVFALAGEKLLEVELRVAVDGPPANRQARITARERRLATVRGLDGTLNESCDGRFLAVGCAGPEPGRRNRIVRIDARDGSQTTVCEIPAGTTYHGHVQWSTTNPHWLSYAGEPYRLWVVDTRDGRPWAPYRELASELVTHESWWVDDQLIFCGGMHAAPREESHVKALDLRRGTVRIIGAGSWWPEAEPEELAKRNWWHAAASADGRWVAADNWHGAIMLFEGHTTRPRLLTTGHRTYGSGTHPEVGWDRKGEQVVFASHRRNTVSVATIPRAWQDELTAARVGLNAK